MTSFEILNSVFKFIRRYWILFLIIIISAFLYLSEKGLPVELGFSSHFGILEFSYSSDGELTFKGNVPIPTPIGNFTLSSNRTIEDIREENENRVLVIIKDNIAYTYELAENFNYKIQKGEGIAIFESIYQDDNNGDIVLKIYTVDPRSISPNEKITLLEDAVTIKKPSENELDSYPSIWNVFDIPPLDMNKPGKKSFSGTVAPDDILEWPYYWCALDINYLSDNLENMTYRFYINDELIPDSEIYRYSKRLNGWVCRYWTILLSNWKSNQIVYLEVVQTILNELSDGYSTYFPGEYRYELIISVK